jgi:GntR family transcriptional regulator, transcriptional repressor for pyruvate dehydrogenase complex
MPYQRNVVARNAWSARDLADLVQLRFIIEPQVAALSAERSSDRQVAAIDHALDVLESIDPPPPDEPADRYLDATAALHRAIAEGCGNTVAASLVVQALDAAPPGVLWLLRPGYVQSPTRPLRRGIARAIRDGDMQAAHDGMHAHLGTLLLIATDLADR